MSKSKEVIETTNKTSATASPESPPDDGVVRSFVTIGSDATESAIGAIFGSVEDVRGNALSRVRGVIDWVEANQQANIDLARRLTDRADELSRALLDGGRQALATVVTTSRNTGHGAAELASRSVTSLFSKTNTQAA